GADRLRRHPDRTSLWVLAAAMSIALFSPIYLGRGDVRAVLSPSATHDAKAVALELVPAGVPVTASNQLGTYLAARRDSYTLPLGGKALWAVIDPNDPTYADAAGYRRTVRQLERNPDWQTVFSSHGITVLRKVR